MILLLGEELLREIRRYAEESYPEEGAGLILGKRGAQTQQATQLMPLANRSINDAHRYRYRLDPQDMLAAELEAQRMGLDLLGVFHSHPDHPAEPSQYDMRWAFPWFSYMITSVREGKAQETRSWRLQQGRGRWSEERLVIQGTSDS